MLNYQRVYVEPELQHITVGTNMVGDIPNLYPKTRYGCMYELASGYD